jgi:CheY-like chemotaxis protein
MTQKVLLLADDQDENRVIFSAVVTHHGYGVFLATDSA